MSRTYTGNLPTPILELGVGNSPLISPLYFPTSGLFFPLMASFFPTSGTFFPTFAAFSALYSFVLKHF